ncbi:hypothetical protein [Roseobacter sp. S98]|uniref:hypothetical protein n=1 Tax=Roseobacter algicola (ex Choi et al. 2025) (nom. illeg.) TaxID=3092138 RepID=UPI003F50D5BD
MPGLRRTLQLAPPFSGVLVLTGQLKVTQAEKFRFLKPAGDLTCSIHLLLMSLLQVGS